MRIELFPCVVQQPQSSPWRWRLISNTSAELALSEATFATAALAEQAVDELMQQIRAEVDVVKMLPSFSNQPSGPGVVWAEESVAFYPAEGELGEIEPVPEQQ